MLLHTETFCSLGALDALARSVVENAEGDELGQLGVQDEAGMVDADVLRELPWATRDLVDELRDYVRELGELGVFLLYAVAKGRARKPGAERLFIPGRRTALQLPPDSPALLLVQQIRDEAHRFAITGHRQRRAKARNTSRLEQIPGLGPKKRRELLRQFGGLQGVIGAGVDDLAKVRGISRTLAETIYNDLHIDGQH